MTLGLSVSVCLIRIGLWFGVKNTTHKDTLPIWSPQEPVTSIWFSLVMLALIIWLNQCLPDFSTVTLLAFPFHTLFFGSESRNPAYTPEKGGSIKHPLLGRGISLYIIWNFSLKKICVFSLCMYLGTYLCQYGYMCIYTLDYNLMLLYLFVSQVAPSLDIWGFFRLDPVSV